MAVPDYKLSAVLSGHSLDVRCVATTKEDCILSASRDRTTKLWHPEGIKDFVNVVTYRGHKNFVGCVCWFPPCEAFPEGLVITGSNDNTILGFYLQDGMIQLTLEGHENVVCCVSAGVDTGLLLSSSWDSTGRIWNLNNSQEKPLVLKGHQASVWAIKQMPTSNYYVTASADKTVKLWNKNGEVVQTLTGHNDCVRDIVIASNETFLTCANDASIRLWSVNGECLNTYYGHSNYVYSISLNQALGTNAFVSAGEDGVVRVWKGADCIRIVTLPAHSVWSVTCLTNGDIVTGSSDGLVRVFTNDPARFADDATLKQFDEQVEQMVAASKQEIGGFKVKDLPGPEILLEPGKSDGQTKLVRRGANVKCYSWSGADQAWKEIGDVMGTNPASEGKTMYQGKEYDFVFSVDIKDGEPPLKLPFNTTEDPWVAAQKFIDLHNLPQVYLEQVTNFIITNAKLNPTFQSNNGYADPLTGESRYVPTAGSVSTNTGSGGYDPFTGANAYSTTNLTEKPLIPHDAYIRFDQANLKAIHDKLMEFNSRNGDGANAIAEQELADIVKLGELKCDFTPETVQLLKRMLEWPKEILFPVLDITRLAVRNIAINKILFDSTYGPNFVSYLLNLIAPDNLPANQMLAMRILVNAFADLAGEMLVLAASESIAHSLLCLNNLNKNTQIAATSLLLNLSVALSQQSDNVELAECIMHVLDKVDDREAYFRGLVALGTLLAESPSKIQIQTKIVSNNYLHNRIKRDSTNSTNDPNLRKINACSQQLLRLL